MKWLRRHHAPEPVPAPPRANPTRIAVLEHDLLGIPPKAGTAAALTIALRTVGTCLEHEPVDTTTYQDLPRRVGLCDRCGVSMLQNDDGDWVVAEA